MIRSVPLACSAVVAALCLSGCGTSDSFQKGFDAGYNKTGPTTTAVPAESTPASPAPAPVTTLIVPAVVGKNGAIARDQLTKLGFTKVEMAADAKSGHQMVLSPANWTVTKIEPAAGSQVQSDDTVVVTMTK